LTNPKIVNASCLKTERGFKLPEVRPLIHAQRASMRVVHFL
jgi:hypothetical protein